MCRRLAASQMASGQTKNFIAVAKPISAPGASSRSRERQASASSRQMGAVRCETRISPAIWGHIATRP